MIIVRRNNRYGIEPWDWEKISWWNRIKIFFWQSEKIDQSCIYVRSRILSEILGRSLKGKEFQCTCSKEGCNWTCWCRCHDGILEHKINGKNP